MSAIAISVVVPAYNEERGIAATVRSLCDWLSARYADFEIIVVDNASTDGTPAALAPLADGERVRVLRNETNLGKGHSVRRGMLAARGALRLHCDADCAVCLPSLERMVELAGEADVVVGSRLAPGAEIAVRQPLRRRMAGRPFIELCRLVLREPTHDLFCGFKLWRAAAARDAFGSVSQPGWVFDAEALALARAHGHRIVETGIVWEDREGSRLQMSRVLVPVVRDLLRARANVRRAMATAATPVPALDARS
jgi:glycosyltransferase involved in cell wall biosynthesis